MYPYKLSGKNNAHLKGVGKDPTIKYGDKHKMIRITFDIRSTPRCKNYNLHCNNFQQICKARKPWR